MGKQSQPSQQTVTQQVKLPAWVENAGQDIYNRTKAAAANMPGPYTGNLVPGLNRDMTNAYSIVRNNVDAGRPAIDAGIDAATRATNYRPTNITAAQTNFQTSAPQIGSRDVDTDYMSRDVNAQTIGSRDVAGGYTNQNVNAQTIGSRDVNGMMIDARDVSASNVNTQFDAPQVRAQNFLSGNVGAYMDPYIQNVEQAALQNLDRQRLQSLNQTADQAISRGAFGGSRQAIMEAVTNAEAARSAGDLSARLRSEGFNNAANIMQQDMNRALTADQLNQATGLDLNRLGLQAEGMNQTANLNALLANQDAALSAAKANQNVDLTAQTANQAAALDASRANQTADLTAQTANQAAGMDANKLNLQADMSNQAAALDAARANQTANLNAQTANQSAALDANRLNLQGDVSNQQAALDAAKTNTAATLANNQLQGQIAMDNTAMQQQANLANQRAGLDAAQLWNQAGFNLGNLGSTLQNTIMSGASALEAVGGAQRDYEGQLLAQDAARYEARRMDPLNRIGYELGALQGVPYGQTTSTTGPAQYQGGNPLMGALGGASTGLSIAKALGAGAGLSGGNMLGAGLGALLGIFSDEKQKTNKKKLGVDKLTGLPIYAYDYKDDVARAQKSGKPMPPKRVGPMAQDIEKKFPGSTRNVGGKRVVKNLGFGGM